MNTKTKMVALLLAALVVGGTTVIAFSAPDENLIAPEVGPSAQAARRLIAGRRMILARWLLTSGEQVTLEGTVVTQVPGVTVVDTGAARMNVLTPARWLLDGETISASDLMARWRGQPVALECLRVEYGGQVRTTIYAVYRVTVGSATAEAILPVNISPA